MFDVYNMFQRVKEAGSSAVTFIFNCACACIHHIQLPRDVYCDWSEVTTHICAVNTNVQWHSIQSTTTSSKGPIPIYQRRGLVRTVHDDAYECMRNAHAHLLTQCQAQAHARKPFHYVRGLYMQTACQSAATTNARPRNMTLLFVACSVSVL